MSLIKSQLQKSLGTVQYIAMMKVLGSITIVINAESECITIFKQGRDPATISFHDLEKLVNDKR